MSKELMKFKEELVTDICLFDDEIGLKLAQNLLMFFKLNRVEVTENEVIISTKGTDFKPQRINYNKDQFLAKMVEMAKKDLFILNGDFSLVPYWNETFKQYDVSAIISYKKKLEILQNFGYHVETYHLRSGDTFTEIKPYYHEFNIKPKNNITKVIKDNKAINDILFYGVSIKNENNEQVCSYVESTGNIRNRAKFKSTAFSDGVNSQDIMYEKFVFGRAYDRLRNYGIQSLPDFDKLEDYNELIDIDYKEISINSDIEKPVKNPKVLEKNTKIWEAVIKRLEEGSANIEQVTANYQIENSDLEELQKICLKVAEKQVINEKEINNEI